ncbi:MAG: F0F1 ATP synthase subunit B family protein [Pseudobdellovibrionaceae bacterium]
MKKWFLFLLVLGTSAALAAAGHGEHESGEIEIPKVVLYQVINVIILFGGLVYFLKGTVVKFYADRKAGYLAAARKSQSAREEAEKQFIDIKHKLDQLQNSEDENISRAKAEATDLKHSLIREAKEMAARIKEEAEQTAKIEIQKAQTHLREQLLKDSLEAAKAVLTKDIGTADHQKLQSEFVNKVQAVNP